MQDSFLTISGRRESELKIKRSRFIATAIPADSREAAEEEYQSLQKQYHDATHNCFAYQVGRDAESGFRYSDDGEPSGTAGRPIYDAITSAGVTDLLVVVTRYYGGIKLGTGGLARAYRDAARQVLEDAKIVEKLIEQRFRIVYDHEQTSIVMKILSDYGIPPLDTSYGEQVTLECAIRLSRFEAIRRELVELSHGRVQVEQV